MLIDIKTMLNQSRHQLNNIFTNSHIARLKIIAQYNVIVNPLQSRRLRFKGRATLHTTTVAFQCLPWRCRENDPSPNSASIHSCLITKVNYFLLHIIKMTGGKIEISIESGIKCSKGIITKKYLTLQNLFLLRLLLSFQGG